MGKLTHIPVKLARLSKTELKKWFDKKYPKESFESHYKQLNKLAGKPDKEDEEPDRKKEK